MSMLEKVLHRGKSRSSPDLVAKTVATLERLDQGSASDKQVTHCHLVPHHQAPCHIHLARCGAAPLCPYRMIRRDLELLEGI